jgi:outer membrane murein-binding lipoprotein Lpp
VLRSTTGARRIVVGAAVSCGLLLSGCSDGTPEFCTPLRQSADLQALGDALDAGDLDLAGAEAQRLVDLADEAPADIRADLQALGEAVVQIVDLLADEASGTSDAGELERRREQLNDDLAELDRRSQRVSSWALQECGMRLE